MESLFQPPVASERIRLLQITDTHLFASEEGALLGINTLQSYHAVLRQIQAEQRPVDLIVATGDLAQDHSLEAYNHFADGVARLAHPCVWLPGNHDFQPAMVDGLQRKGIQPSKQVLLGEHWQLILLDSQVLGVPHGELNDYQLNWLAEKMDQHPQRHAVILLHHHPQPSGCTWLDQHSLRNAGALQEVLRTRPQAKVIVCGHIHQEMDCLWSQCRLLATPSTCIQFKAHCTNFTLDQLSPGWRYLDLLPDGTVETQVHRLPGQQFCPDMESEGY